VLKTRLLQGVGLRHVVTDLDAQLRQLLSQAYANTSIADALTMHVQHVQFHAGLLSISLIIRAISLRSFLLRLAGTTPV